MRIAMVQCNPVVGDLAGNAARVEAGVRRAASLGADLCLSTEMVLTGYPPRDLLLLDDFVREAGETAADLAARLADCPPVLLGSVAPTGSGRGKPLHNAALLLRGGRVERAYCKTLLPTYDVFDEARYFEPFCGDRILEVAGHRLAVTICEDIWNDAGFWEHPLYERDPLQELRGQGVEAILNLSASPFTQGKIRVREQMLASIAKSHGVPILYANQAGGNDDLLFDGRSCAAAPDGKIFARAKAFAEDVLIVELDGCESELHEPDLSPLEEVYRGLVTGLADYTHKTCFEKVLLGLSGGIDSALTAVLAAHALGRENVLGVCMPSPWSSKGSVADSLELAKRLGIATVTLPIEGVMRAFDETLAPVFAGREPDVTEENLQARIRGNLLMALSNKFRSLLLTTGNKSELSVGYCTIYGDMSGGLAVISDVPKTMVYALSRWINERFDAPIPEAILTKAPSAELRPDQTDQDSLPPYDVLDAILRLHVEEGRGAAEIAARGFDADVVAQVMRLVQRAEFKRRQAPPGLKVTQRAFGTGWRMPLACRMG
ncbi:NAD+ synthetase [Desulfovibrio sp. X2]|uniref:NAD+ synthase n=1 Tax=Desulfovibrio sp. X2 TaxID=941449 RepID=UPI0003589AE7|nr:NAD+ synthase [Desulfovibrio sp. X2]EPR44039.1 NAD+ synthetase [Desulfovibrio sp. X2]